MADLYVRIRFSDESYVKDRGVDLDLTAFPELLHDLPVQDSSQKNPLAGCWYDKWKLADVQPLRKAWFGELRDKYGTAAQPEILDPRTAPDFRGVKARILQKCVRQLVGSKLHKILFRKIGITPGSIRYVLCPAWLLSVTLGGKTYLSVMNASNRSDIILSVPRSLLRRIVTALAFASYGAGLFALANIPVTAPEPTGPYDWLNVPICLLYLPSLALILASGVKSYGFCCRRLFKGMFSVLVTSLAVLLAGLLMIYAFFAVYEGPNAIEWGGGGDLHRLRCVVNAVLSFKALTI